jgi:hypothetical protein
LSFKSRINHLAIAEGRSALVAISAIIADSTKPTKCKDHRRTSRVCNAQSTDRLVHQILTTTALRSFPSRFF